MSETKSHGSLAFQTTVDKGGLLAKHRTVVEVDLDNRVLTFTKKGTKKRKVVHTHYVVYAHRHPRKPRRVELSWHKPPKPAKASKRKGSSVQPAAPVLEEQFSGSARKADVLFKTFQDRERFMQAAWAAGWLHETVDRESQGNPDTELVRAALTESGAPRAVEPVRVFVGTWNVGNAEPAGNDKLRQWLLPTFQGHDDLTHDVYLVTAQECAYGDPGKCEADWFRRVAEVLGDDYVQVTGRSLGEIRTSMHVRKRHLHKITLVDNGTEATGIAHVMSNKGGVGLFCRFNDTSLEFVGSHLAAHQGNVQDRLSDHFEIIDGLRSDKIIQPHTDLRLWAGDLNFRIDLHRDACLALIDKKAWSRLAGSDQLNQLRATREAFVCYEEGVTNFQPTYKYKRGVRDYDDYKARVPSWCDRVLWLKSPALGIKQRAYDCVQDVMTSDHSPVFASFVVETKVPGWPEPAEACLLCVRDVRLVYVDVRRRRKKSAKLLKEASQSGADLTKLVQSLSQGKLSAPDGDDGGGSGDGDSAAVETSTGEARVRDCRLRVVSALFEKPLVASAVQRKVSKKEEKAGAAPPPLDLAFADDAFEPVTPVVTGRERLMVENLYVEVKGHVENESDDLYGYCTVGLNEACGAEPAPFCQHVLYRGKDTGARLVGTVHVWWPNRKPADVEKQRKKIQATIRHKPQQVSHQATAEAVAMLKQMDAEQQDRDDDDSGEEVEEVAYPDLTQLVTGLSGVDLQATIDEAEPADDPLASKDRIGSVHVQSSEDFFRDAHAAGEETKEMGRVKR